MTQLPRITGVQPALLYRATCPKCCWLSFMVVSLSCGWVRRIPVDSPEALQLYTRFGQPHDRLALLYHGGFRTGWTISVFALMALFEGVADAAGRWLVAGVAHGRRRAD
jgi:hypothetical protein